MAIAFGAIGAKSAGGTTALSVPYPSGISAGDILLLFRVIWPTAAAATTPAGGWVNIVNANSGSGNPGLAGSHVTRIVVDWKEADGTESGNLDTAQNASTNGALGVIVRYTKSSSMAWDVVGCGTTGAGDTSHGTNRATSDSAAFELASGDLMIAGIGSDVATDLSPSAFVFQHNSSQTGIGTKTRRTSGTGVTTGNDGNVDVIDAPYTGTTKTAGAAFSWTTGTQQCGPAGFLRLREVTPPETPVSGDDGGSLAASESTEIVSTSTSTDTGSIAVSDTSSLFKDIPSSDTGSLASAETSAVDSTTTTSDSATVSVDETTEVVVVISTSDTASVAETEDTSSAGSLDVSDNSSLSVSETHELFKDITSSDNGSLALTEVANADLGGVGTDSATIGVDDAGMVLVTLNVTDTGSLATSETTDQSVSVSVSDSNALDITEESQSALFTSVSDSGALAVSEEQDSVLAESLTDGGGFAVSETTEFSKFITSEDAGVLAVEDEGVIHQDQPGSDTAAIGLTEEVDIVTAGEIEKAASDSGAIGVLDSLDSTTIVLEATDTNSLTATDETTHELTTQTGDTGAVAIDETAVLFKPVEAEDTSEVSVSESSTQTVVAPGTDTSSILVSETSEVEHFGIVEKSSADGGSLAATEDTASEVGLSVVDSVVLVVNENRTSYIEATFNDTTEIDVVEASAVSVVLGSSDGGTLALSETTDIDAVDGVAEVSASDTAAISISEFKNVSDPDAPEQVVHMNTHTTQTTNLATGTDADTMVIEYSVTETSVESESETTQRVEVTNLE